MIFRDGGGVGTRERQVLGLPAEEMMGKWESSANATTVYQRPAITSEHRRRSTIHRSAPGDLTVRGIWK